MSRSIVRRGTKRARVGPGSAGISMTLEEFDALTREDCVPGYRYELIRGILVVTPPPGGGEADPNDELARLFRNYQVDDPRSTLDLTLPERYVAGLSDRRRADRLVWAGLGRLPDEETDVPTIVIEIVSQRRRDWVRDYETKRDEYLAAGVREYWVIDRFRRSMTVHRNTPEGITTATIPEDQPYRTDLLPGFELPLGRLIAMADRWSKSKPPRTGRGPA